MKALGTRQQGQELRQSKVRSAALELFTTRGFEATSVRDIAAAAGVSVGTVAHAGDKAKLFLDSMEESAFAVIGDGLQRLCSEPVRADLSLAAEICGVFEPSLAWAVDNQELTRAYLIAYLRADGAHATSAGQIEVICARLAARCVEHSGGQGDVSAALLAAGVIYAVFASVLLSIASGAVGSPQEMDQWWREFVTQQTRPFEHAGASS